MNIPEIKIVQRIERALDSYTPLSKYKRHRRPSDFPLRNGIPHFNSENNLHAIALGFPFPLPTRREPVSWYNTLRRDRRCRFTSTSAHSVKRGSSIWHGRPTRHRPPALRAAPPRSPSCSRSSTPRTGDRLHPLRRSKPPHGR